MPSRLRDVLMAAFGVALMRSLVRQQRPAAVPRAAPDEPPIAGHPGLLGASLLALGVVSGLALVGNTLLQAHRETQAVARALTRGDAQAAPRLAIAFGCAGCHTMPGIPGADGQVGPPLGQYRQRVFIAGLVRNTPDALVRWIVAPQELAPRSAMPATGISEAQARDIAAWLYAH